MLQMESTAYLWTVTPKMSQFGKGRNDLFREILVEVCRTIWVNTVDVLFIY